MEESEINDIRDKSEFKGKTFSEFKKCDVKKELLKSLYHSKIEPSCYWSAELICSGHYLDLWDIIIDFYSRHIHTGNPKLIIYLDKRMNDFKEIVNSGYLNQELRLRNNMKIRKLFCEIMCILCESKKQHSYDEIKVKKEDFDLHETHMSERFKAPNTSYAETIYQKGDPKEIFIAINELAFHLSNEGKNAVHSCYWIEWIIDFETLIKKEKEKEKDKYHCERRIFAPVDHKSQMDVIWMIWDIFLNESIKRNPLVQKIVNSALEIFSLKYTTGSIRKRKLLLYFVVGILTENGNLMEEMLKEKQKIASVMEQINNIYIQVKKNEHSPGTDYLYTNIKASNLEKTIAKLETMNHFQTEFIPRI